MRLRRRPWPQELVDAVRAAAPRDAGGSDDILAAVQLTDGRWVAGGRAALYLPDDREGAAGNAAAEDTPVQGATARGTTAHGPTAQGDEDRGGVDHSSTDLSGAGLSDAGVSGADGGGVRRVGWENIQRAGWDSEKSVLQVWETTSFGTPLRATALAVDDPGKLGQLLRERIDASVLVQRHVPLVGKKGVRIVGRRNPADPDAKVSWSFVLDKGLSPDRPGLVDDAEAALTAVREEFGI